MWSAYRKGLLLHDPIGDFKNLLVDQVIVNRNGFEGMVGNYIGRKHRLR